MALFYECTYCENAWKNDNNCNIVFIFTCVLFIFTSDDKIFIFTLIFTLTFSTLTYWKCQAQGKKHFLFCLLIVVYGFNPAYSLKQGAMEEADEVKQFSLESKQARKAREKPQNVVKSAKKIVRWDMFFWC